MWIKICEKKKTEHYNSKEKAWVYTRYLLKRQWTELHTKQHTWRWWNNNKKKKRSKVSPPCTLYSAFVIWLPLFSTAVVLFFFFCACYCFFFLCVYVWESCKEKTFWVFPCFFLFSRPSGTNEKRWRLKKTGSFICASLTDLSTDDCFLICFPLWVWK